MKKRIVVSLVLLCLPVTYLLFWPVAIAPVSWQAPSNLGFSGQFAPNNDLTSAELIELDGFSGPEAVVASEAFGIFVSTHEGWVLHASRVGDPLKPLVNTGGRPLGLALDDTGNLYIADAYKGLLRYQSTTGLEVLVQEFNGAQLNYVNDVAVSHHGRVYFTDSSEKFGAQANGGTYSASLLDIMEHGGHGRLFSFDLHSQALIEVAHGFNFANGVAVLEAEHESADTIFVSETGNYRVLAFEVVDSVVQSQKALLENLPGFPDNIATAPDGSLWLGLVSPRNAILDRLSDAPWLRKMVQRMPAFLRPKATHYGVVINVSVTGDIISQHQDPSGAIYTTTGAAVWGDYLYISRLQGDSLARLSLSQK